MSVLSKPYFHNEEAAFEHLEKVIWPNGPFCPHCGGTDRICDQAEPCEARSHGPAQVW